MTREDFVGRIRGALHRQPGDPLEAPPALLVPLMEWDEDVLVEQFKLELEAVGGHVHVLADVAEARERLEAVLSELGVTSFIRTSDEVVDEVLGDLYLPLNDNPAAADVGISGARCAIANTGTLVLTSEMGRKASLLPMNHVAILKAEQIVPSMAEALETYLDELPSVWVQATGPSRTADIELTLTTGVHGPGVTHVILVREE